jgi:hypothetical protein
MAGWSPKNRRHEMDLEATCPRCGECRLIECVSGRLGEWVCAVCSKAWRPGQDPTLISDDQSPQGGRLELGRVVAEKHEGGRLKTTGWSPKNGNR